MSVKKVMGVFVILGLLFFYAWPAGADELSDLKSQVKSMQGQINMLLNRIEQLEGQKTQKAQAAPVDIENRVSALEDKMQKPFLSKLASSSFNMKGYLQSYYLWQEHDSGEDTFETRRARIYFYGDIMEDFKYKLQFDMSAGNDILRDAYITYKHFSWANITVGQMLMPYSERDLVSSTKLDTIISPLVVAALATDRDIGVMVSGKILDDSVSYSVGIFNGAGKNVADNNENKDVVGRVTYSPFKSSDNKFLSGLSFGGAIQTGRQPLSGNYEGSRDRYSGLLMYEYYNLKITGEYLYQSRERTGSLSDEEAQGWYLSSKYQITPKVSGVVMYEQYDPNLDISRDQQDVLTLGGAYQLNKYVRLDLNYRQIFEQDPNTDTNNQVVLQAQVEF